MTPITLETLQLFRRFEYLETQRSVFDRHWEELLTFMNPNATRPRTSDSPGAKRSVGLIFSSVVLNAVSTAVAAISGIIAPSTSKWFDLELAQKELNSLPGVAAWLEEASTVAFEEMVNSNLSTAIGQVVRDLLIVGTANLFSTQRNGFDDTFEGLNFITYEAGSYVIAENNEKEIDTVFQKLKMSYRAAALQWGKEQLSQDAQSRLKDYPDEMMDILHCQYPREDVNPKAITESTPATKLPMASCYIEMKTKHKIAEGGFHERAYLIPRWTVFTGEIYGRSPAMDALPDVKTLNKQRELHLKALAKQIDPPLAILDRRVIGKLSTDPGARNYVHDPNAIIPLNVTGDLRGTAIDEAQLENTIRQIFFNHLLQFPTQNQQGGTTPVSATEFSLRSEQMLRNAIPSIAVIQNELLKPLVERVFGILLRAGRLPNPPEALLQQKNTRFTVRYSNPIAKSQKAQEAEAVLQHLALAIQYSQVVPEMLEVLKLEELGFYLAEKSSIPKSIIKSPEELQAEREQKAQAQQAQAIPGVFSEFGSGLKDVGAGIKSLREASAIPNAQQGGQ